MLKELNGKKVHPVRQMVAQGCVYPVIKDQEGCVYMPFQSIPGAPIEYIGIDTSKIAEISSEDQE